MSIQTPKMSSRSRLSASSKINSGVTQFDYDRTQHGCGIVHLGCGAFHRAHQAVYTDDALKRSGGDWMITAASLRSGAVARKLNEQDGLYSLLESDAQGTRARLIGSIRRVICCSDDREALFQILCAKQTLIVSMTVTEKAYGLNRATGGVDISDSTIAADLANPAQPQGVVAVLVESLRRRHLTGMNPFTVLCCDNLPDNGRAVRLAVLDYAARLLDAGKLSHEFVSWLESRVAFPATMVDRITPAATANTRSKAAHELGVEDHAAVESEVFSQWVVEDDFPAGRPDWEAGGALMVESVEPYERMKLRMLNGAHSMLAYVSVVAGIETVCEAVADSALNLLIKRHLVSAAGTLSPLPGVQFEEYAQQLLHRFANPSIRHQTRQIAMDGSEKVGVRFFSAAADAQDKGQNLAVFSFATAAWMHFCRGISDKGTRIEIDDPRSALILEAVGSASSEAHLYDSLVQALGLKPDKLLQSAEFRREVVVFLEMMAQDGMRSVMVLSVAFWCINSCASVPDEVSMADKRLQDSPTVGEETFPMAELTAFEQNPEDVQVRVITTGCTRADDLQPVIERLTASEVQLTVLRIRADDCRRMPSEKTVRFSRKLLGIDQENIILMNPLVVLSRRG